MKTIIINIIAIICCAPTLNVWAQANNNNPAISVSEFTLRVLEYSQDVKMSKQQRIAIQEAMRLAKTAYLPSFSIDGNFQYRINDLDLEFAGAKLAFEHPSYYAQGTIAQPIYAGGAIRNNNKSIQVQTEIAIQSEELTINNVTYTAELAYWGAVAQKEMYETMIKYVDIIATLEEILKERFDAGGISKTDLIQVQVQLKDAENQKIDVYKTYLIALQNLNVLMGLKPESDINLQGTIAELVNLPIRQSLNNILSHRPEYSIYGLNVEYQELQRKLALSQYNPQLAIGLNGNWGTSTLNFDGSTFFNTTTFATLSIPVFHWGAKYKTNNSQKALVTSKKLELQKIKDNISQETSRAWVNYTETSKQITVIDKTCELAEENLSLNTFSYTEGRLPIIDVLSAQLTWIQAYTNRISTYYQQKIAIADYNKSIGYMQ